MLISDGTGAGAPTGDIAGFDFALAENEGTRIDGAGIIVEKTQAVVIALSFAFCIADFGTAGGAVIETVLELGGSVGHGDKKAQDEASIAASRGSEARRVKGRKEGGPRKSAMVSGVIAYEIVTL